MRVLYTGLRWNYGKKDEGDAYEYCNLEAGIRDCANKGLLQLDVWNPDNNSNPNYPTEKVLADEVDLIFNVAFNDTYDLPLQAAQLALKKDIPVLEWHCDTSWRYNDFTRNRKNRVSHFITTHIKTMDWFKADGLKAIYSQWGCSPLYTRYDLPNGYFYNCSQVGQKHGIRPQIVQALVNAGLEVHLFGQYWEGFPNWHGYLPNIIPDVVNIFNQTKVNFNWSNPWHINTPPQIKGRFFELPACGAFQLTTPADDLERYFVPDKEIVVAKDLNDLVEKAKYYLEHDKEREEIAEAGYQRAIKDHSWQNRFQAIFKELGI